MLRNAKRLLQEDTGQDLVEYALLAAIIALVVVTGLSNLASKINSQFNKIGSDI
jgi:pilus assembly protein Flp/PilA